MIRPIERLDPRRLFVRVVERSNSSAPVRFRDSILLFVVKRFTEMEGRPVGRRRCGDDHTQRFDGCVDCSGVHGGRVRGR